jgi:hypothetical protein
MSESRASLELGLIGNCTFNALVDRAADIVWCCMPRPDGDPVLHALLGQAAENGVTGRFAIEVEGLAETRQRYIANTAILETELVDRAGNVARVTDFAPRFTDRGRTFRPLLLVRRIVPISGRPTFRLRLDPGFDYGARRPEVTRGSHHVRYVHAGQAVRLTTDMPIAYVIGETPHLLDRPINMLFGVDETIDRNVGDLAREFEERTEDYWRRFPSGASRHSQAIAAAVPCASATRRTSIISTMCTVTPSSPRRRHSSITGCCGRRASMTSAAWSGSASAPSNSTISRTRASGNSAPARRRTRRRRSCAGRRAIAWPRSLATSGSPRPRIIGADTRNAFVRSFSNAHGAKHAAPSSRASAVPTWMPACC